MNRTGGALVLAAAVAAAACGEGAKSPAGAARAELAAPYVKALREEATGDPAEAKRLYLRALDGALAAPSDPYAVPVLAASLDALVMRRVGALAEVSGDTALAFRTKDHALAPGEPVVAHLTGALGRGDDPFTGGLVARAMQRVAEHHGDAVAAEKWRAATGCAREATVVGPLAWAPITGLAEPDPLERFDAKVPATAALPGPFVTELAPVSVKDRGCAIELGATNALHGVRDVVVDVKIPSAGPIGVGLWSTAPATLRAGGKVVLERPAELGSGDVARFARVDAPRAGTLRVVARVGMDSEGDTVQIGAWDAHGKPLAVRAPRAGDAADVEVKTSTALAYPAPRTDDEKVALAAGALALGDGRTAERTLAGDAARPSAPPELELVYARAVETARDLSQVHRAERARAAYEKVLDAWPASWEAALAHAVLAGVRRGSSEQRIELLADLDKRRAKLAQGGGAQGAFALPLFDAFDAATSGREGLFDRARAAFERARGPLDGSALLYDAGRAAFERVGAERVAYACTERPPNARASLECHDALWTAGERGAAEKELDRVRRVLGASGAYLAVSLRESLAAGDPSASTALLGRMLPGERTLTAMYASTVPHGAAALLANAPTARDAPWALPSLLRADGSDPIAPFAGVAEKVVAADRASPIMPTAPTVILAHTERYWVERTGLVHYVMLDVRRVSGTTDVEENAQAVPPDLTGRDVLRILRRRIFKKDGRVLEPDRTPMASQSHADLSQLEQGDCVEAMFEGWALPGETGNVGIDTPDLLADRTAVHDATIELHLPQHLPGGLAGSMWSHPLLGKPAEKVEPTTRVLTWHLADKPVRRLEDGVPKMDRSVSVSFGTATWADVARALNETLAGLDEHDPEIAQWAQRAAAGAQTEQEKVARVVEAAGEAVKESAPSVLTELDGVGAEAQTQTARTILTSREGSRTWLVVRALRELGVRADVVLAENDPFSADPAFPPHFGRFLHPLAVAHADGKDLWIDADVQGPPLPAGRVSPELRGRMALDVKGAVTALPAIGGDGERDEVDIRLAVDAKGDAKGSLTVLLRGRAAQELAEALVRIVGAERQRALRAVALAWVPYANVDDVQLSSSEGSWQVALRADVTIPGYAQAEGSPQTRTWVLPGIDPLHTMFPRAYVTTLGATYASRSARENALAISRAVQYHAHRRVELPPGASVVRTPGPFDTKSPQIEASRKIAVSGGVIEEEFVLGVTTGTVPRDRYGAFVTDVHKTDDAFLASTRVRPQG